MTEVEHIECKFHEKEFDDFGSYDVCYNPKSSSPSCAHCINEQERCPLYVKGRTLIHIDLGC